MKEKGALHLLFLFLVFTLIVPSLSRGALDEDQLPPVLKVKDEGDGYVLLNWSVPQEADIDNITMFHVHRKDLVSPFDPVASNVFTYNDTTVENGVEYTYTVSAEYFNQSLKAVSEPLIAYPGTVPEPPEITGIFQEESRVSVTFVNQGSSGGYPVRDILVQRKGESENFTTISILNGTAASFDDPSVKYGLEYTYRLIAVNLKGPSAPGGPRSIMMIPPPEAPGNVIGLESGNDGYSITLSWGLPADDGGSDLLGFKIIRNMNGSGLTEIAVLSPRYLTYRDVNVSINTNYTYLVIAFNSIGEAMDPPSVNERIIMPVNNGGDSGETEDDNPYLVRNSILIGGLIGVVIIAVAIFVYLRLTEEVDEEEIQK